MKVLTCFLIFGIFGKIQTSKQAANAKSVNLALETILEFDRKDNAVDTKFIDQVQNFLSNVKNLINTKRKTRRSNDNGLSFTEFVAKALHIIKTYDDDDLSRLVRIIDEESRKYHYRGCKFHELLENHDIRRFLAIKLDNIKNRPIKDIRKDINNVLRGLGRLSDEERMFFKYVNSLYRHYDMNKFTSVLNNLESYTNKYKRSEINLGKIMRDGFRNILFDHYTDLKDNVKKDFKVKLDAFCSVYISPKDNKLTIRRPSIARNIKLTSPKTYTAENVMKPLNENKITDFINNYYDKMNLLKTIKQYIVDVNKASNLETNTGHHDTKGKKSKKKQKHKQSSFELYDFDTKSDFINNKASIELITNKNNERKKHKRQRHHKNKDKKKHVLRSAETVQISEKSKGKHHKNQKYTPSGRDKPIEISLYREKNVERKKKWQPKLKVASIARDGPERNKTEKKHKKDQKEKKDKIKVKTFSPVLRMSPVIENTKSISSESLEGNESFNRQRARSSHTDESSDPSRYWSKKTEDPRRWFERRTTSHKGIAIESNELAKHNLLSRKVNDNDTLPISNKTITKSHKSTDVEDATEVTKDVHDVTYDDLEYWKRTTKIKELITTPKVNITTPATVQVTTMNVSLNNTIKEENITVLNKSVAFTQVSNKSDDVQREVLLEEPRNGTLVARTQLAVESFVNSTVTVGDQKHKVRQQMREDINKLLGKTMEATTEHDVMKFTDPLQALEDVVDSL